MKIFKFIVVFLLNSALCSANSKPIILAYVTSWSIVLPDPRYLTHINYAFGHVNDTFNGIRVDNPERLKNIVKLKQQFLSLKYCFQLAVGVVVNLVKWPLQL